MEDNDELFVPLKKQKVQKSEAIQGLYLETVNRGLLDFDFEHLCSVSLTNINVYACLVCGKYFQGRGIHSHAYYHSINDDHHVFIHLESLKVFVLPEGYEVMDSFLADIKYIINPTFTKDDISQLEVQISTDLNGKQYIPGYVGMNNLNQIDYVNVLVQALAHVPPTRDYFLLNTHSSQSELVRRFGLLIRKLWNPKAFKGHVSPHEFVQEVSRVSKKQFVIGSQSDPIQFLNFLLNSLHVGLGGSKKKSSIVHQTFQGELKVESQTVISIGSSDGTKKSETGFGVTVTPFLFLTLDLPPTPLFADEDDRNGFPQVSLLELLCKFDGKTVIQSGNSVKRFSILKLPEYLIFCVKRFSKNSFVSEKNPTIINFPIKHLDMKAYLASESKETHTRYDLIANVLYEGGDELSKGVFKVDILRPSTNQWYRIQDMFVDEIMAQLINLSETYIQIWKQEK